ncbi:hypothetical protein PILCRDRAFT_819601 [Piloderma croceum F 1598]|uniref:Uncharacterized protein n=1 Tax=Piloderma croceum (strain F 1598) TaxID=765440 RepID=A0A0C3FG34_PILCF|nr:hypothetical protein PILCRDRAFT_819601 [Piloderma croceum F 1598]
MNQSNNMIKTDSEMCVDPDECSYPKHVGAHAARHNSREGPENSDIDISGVTLENVESILHASFEQNAAVLACLAVRYIHKGIEGFKSSDAYLARHNCDECNLVLKGIPNGSLIKFVADISAMTNAELNDNRWYRYDRNCQSKAHLSL